MKCDTCDGTGRIEIPEPHYSPVVKSYPLCPDCGGCGLAPIPEAFAEAVECLRSIAESDSRQADYANRTLQHIEDSTPPH